MKIEVLSIVDDAVEAWKRSRPLDFDPDVSAIRNLDLPVNEFTVFNLFIESTIYEREIFSSLRNHVMWARGSRTEENIFDFKIDECFSERTEFYEKIRNSMKESVSRGDRQDDYRLQLPLVSTTGYNLSISARQLIKVALFMTDMLKDCNDDYMKVRFLRSSRQIHGLLQDNGIEYNVLNFKPINVINKKISSKQSFSHDGVTSIEFTATFSMRAQLVRHRELKVVDNLYYMMTSHSASFQTLSSKMLIQAVGLTQDIESVFSKRNCWASNYKIWKGFMQEADNTISNKKLPCDSCGLCPFGKDVDLRVKGQDPNPPCPRFMHINNIKPTEEQVDDMRAMIFEDDRDAIFWNKEINQLETEL